MGVLRGAGGRLGIPWWGLVLMVPLLAALVVVLSFSFGDSILPGAYWVEGAAFAMASGAALLVLMLVTRCGSLPVGAAVFVVTTVTVAAWGLAVYHDFARDGFWRWAHSEEAADLPDGWRSLDRHALYAARIRQVVGEDAGGLLGHLRLEAAQGVWNRERDGPRRLGGKYRWVHRGGFWVWVGWTTQILALTAGNFLGVLFGVAWVGTGRDDRRRRELWEDRPEGRARTRRELAKLLGTRDPEVLRLVQESMGRLARLLHNRDLAPEERAAAEAHRDQVAERYYGEPVASPVVVLLEHVDRVPGAGFYDRARLLVRAYRQIYRERAELPPLPGLDCRALPPFRPDAPAGAFAPLLEPGARFWRSSLYVELMRMAPGEIPDEALPALVHQMLEDTNPKIYEHLPVRRPNEVLAPVGPRLYPALARALCRGEPFAGRAWLPVKLYDLVTDWPDPLARPLFRAAFAAGWNDCSRHLPDRPWARELVGDFADSPFGEPRLLR